MLWADRDDQTESDMKLTEGIILGGLAMAALAAPVARAADAKAILEAAGVKGGLVVHVGCGDGVLTAALRAGESYLVHGLARDAKNVAAARAHIRSRKLGGKPPGPLAGVSVARFDGRHLPYVDNLVNLVVAEDLGDVAMAEVMRVLCPNGVAYVKTGGEPGRRLVRRSLGEAGSLGEGGWTKTTKPRPKEIDDWTHYLHGPGNNAVANDTVVGPPRRLQWTGGPKWGRHHDHMSSISAMVTAGGRLFAIIDEGPSASILLPPKWRLVARDAFNGTLLWKRDIAEWFPHLFPLKSGPANLPRRLVAVGEVVYATLGIEAPVSALDAATGKTIRRYAGSGGAEEIRARRFAGTPARGARRRSSYPAPRSSSWSARLPRPHPRGRRSARRAGVSTAARPALRRWPGCGPASRASTGTAPTAPSRPTRGILAGCCGPGAAALCR